MQIEVNGLGKKYNKQWVFRHLDYIFNNNASYAITGPNGSGKSTLLQILTGFFPPSEGTISYQRKDSKIINEDDFYNYFDIVTPYLELIEEFTLQEFIEFHFKFKKLKVGFSLDEVVYKMYLDKDRNKLINNFSSGMKQRLKLGIAFFSQSPICFLDEPTSNLDEKGVSWYLENVKEAINDKLVIISSNQTHEYDFCDHVLNIPDFQ
jgi:ABC-type multidrug transport system ATPase subunit